MVVSQPMERSGVEEAAQGRCGEGGTGAAAAPAHADVPAMDCRPAAHRQRQLWFALGQAAMNHCRLLELTPSLHVINIDLFGLDVVGGDACLNAPPEGDDSPVCSKYGSRRYLGTDMTGQRVTPVPRLLLVGHRR